MAKKSFVGKVVSTKMQHTAVVLSERKIRHPIYSKIVKRKKKFYADDSIGVKEGDWVRVEEHKPTSKLKKFVVTEVLKGKSK